jgi:hypothetical protein
VSRLPTPGGDADAWATILNDYLRQSLAPDGTLVAALTIGGDANLHRTAPGNLQTDGNLVLLGYLDATRLVVQTGTAKQIDIYTDGKIYFGPYDTNLHRAAAGVLATDGYFVTTGGHNLISNWGQPTSVEIGGISSGFAGFLLGGAGDTNLYRESANVLKTSGVIKATAFTVAASTKPGEEPGDEINLLTLIERLSDRVAELEAKLEQ